MTLDVGDLPTWLASVGAFIAAGIAWHTFRADVDERRQLARRAQAEKVTAWLVQSTISNWFFDSSGVAIRNASDQAVYNVSVYIFDAIEVEDEDGNTITHLRPDPVALHFPQLGPTSEPMFIRWLGVDNKDGSTVSRHAELVLTFRDATGVLWTREGSGLSEKYFSYEGPINTDPVGLWEDLHWQYGLPDDLQRRADDSGS